MERLRNILLPGLRLLDESGRMTGEQAGREALGGVESIFVVDLEMSGANAQMHEVMDVAGVRAKLEPGLPEMESWGTKVRPRHIGNAEPAALKVIGYNPKAWREAVDLGAAMEGFTRVGAGAMITGWGISQDIAFIVESLRRLTRPWPFAAVAFDVQPVARAVLKSGEQVDRFNLGHVADRLGIGRLGEHGALADAYATYDVLLKLIELIENGSGGTGR
ncbi:MAG: 3'-5' exonuclease [Dehalococcoidia bacterium]|nr:3'-5' exonuclease [Dehalococcoidia bacterium]MCL4230581.1 3'-5' exonuclease [Dehalococcoidia bacterium]NUQ54777.1 3'-5' exonuclease [Dehalococcoidia bacterium]